MEFLRFLEGLRTPFFDAVMQCVTLLGEETLFMVIAMIFYWCVDKRKGYFLLYVGLLGTVVNQFLKILCRIPRPWVRDTSFTIVESAREGAGGYSFPSGHTQTVAGTFGGIACFARKAWMKLGCIVLLLVVAFSRMYLGVHTPADVLVSLGVAGVLLAICWPLFRQTDRKPSLYLWLFGALIACSIGFVVYASAAQAPAGATESDIANFVSAQKTAWQMLGTSVGILLAYLFDTHVSHFETKALFWLQIVKVAGGMALVLAVRMLLKEPLLALTGNHPSAHGLRYLLMTVAGGGLWPLSFRFFKGKKPAGAAAEA